MITTRREIKNKVIDIINNVTRNWGSKIDETNINTPLEELGIGPLEQLDTADVLGRIYDIIIDVKTVRKLKTTNDYIDHITASLKPTFDGVDKIGDRYQVSCTCGTEAVSVYFDKEYDIVEFSIWYHGLKHCGFLERMKHAWHTLISGPYGDQVVLTKRQARELGQLLILHSECNKEKKK